MSCSQKLPLGIAKVAKRNTLQDIAKGLLIIACLPVRVCKPHISVQIQKGTATFERIVVHHPLLSDPLKRPVQSGIHHRRKLLHIAKKIHKKATKWTAS